MSTALAIASVTWVLKDLLNNGLIDHNVPGNIGMNILVTALPPDRIDTGSATENAQLNLFMYMATHNAGWRNQGLPSLNSRGDRISNPPLALDLHYLLTAYGSEELHHEILLGYGMQLLHESPVLAREAIRRSLPPTTIINGSSLPLSLRILSNSALADQVELIRITPEVLNPEEISRLWAAFGTKYRPAAAYKATVVLIESRQSTSPALPVRQTNIYTNTFHQPVLETISSQAAPGAAIADNQKILPGYHLVLRGTQLAAEMVTVQVDEMETIPAAGSQTDTQLTIPLPAGLRAGVHGVQVVHKMLMGSPPLPHQGTSSNVQAFILSPRINAVQVEAVTDAGKGLRSASVKLVVEPEVAASQRTMLLLNEVNADPAAVPRLYTFPVELDPEAPSGKLSVPVSSIKPGTYLVRLQVDGAESPLQTDAAMKFTFPQLTIT